MLQRKPFQDSYQYKTVEPGERELVFEILVSGGYTAFVRTVSWDWYADTFYEFKIDGKLKRKIEYTFNITEPTKFDPPLIAEKWIRFWFTNNSEFSIVAGVLCDGEMVRERRG